MYLKTLTKSFLLAFMLLFGSAAAGTLVGAKLVNEAHAAVVSSIDVRGNQRIDDEIVASYLTISPGQSFNNFDIDDSIKALFATGLFSDVSIFQQGSVLVVDVDENATINKVQFEGNNRLKDDALKSIVSLKEQGVYSDEQAGIDVARIREAYGRVGKRGTKVSFEVLPLQNNRVNVIYRIDEGDKTKIASINFVGNDTFSDRHLRDVISTKESSFLSFLQTNDVYDPNRISADEEALRNFYFNRGFADFQILSSSADLDEVANEYTITFTFDEGARYSFGNISIDSTVPNLDTTGLESLYETVPGDFYSAKKVEKTIVALTERVSEAGFAFVEVVPRGNRNFETNTIDVVYLVDEGARVFIEDIVINGNDRTRDYVIRREFDISEGDAYNRVLVNKTRDRIQALGFFESVNVTTRPGSSPDRIRVIVSVVERSTGDISLSGSASSSGFGGQLSLTERNFLGRGQFLRVAFASGTDEDSYSFNFTEPYFLGYRISAGISLSATETDSTSERQYLIDTNDARIAFGLPITEDLRASVFYAYRGTDSSTQSSFLDATATGSAQNNDGTQGNASNELSAALASDLGDYIASGLGYSLTYNTLDNQRTPREGLRATFSQTYYGVGGDANYLQTEAQLAAYHLLSEEDDIILFGRVRGGHQEQFGGNGTNSINDTLRTLDNFQASSKTIRGFDSFGYGPRDPVTGDPLGGQTFWNATAEILFPLPFVSRSLGLRGAFFADAGQLINPGNGTIAAVRTANPGADLTQLDDDALRASVGASVLWDSPFGPLRVDYAVPVEDQPFDDIREFSFGVSSAF